VFIIDRDYRIVRVNKKICDALKKKPEELVGKRCYEVLHGKDKPWPNCPHRKTLETKEAASAEIDDPNLGMPLLVTNSPIFGEKGELVQCVHVAKDITERKKVEDALRESEMKFRTIVENCQDVIMLTKPDGIISYLSPACSRVLGYDPQDLVGNQPWIIHPDDLEDVKQVHYQALRGKNGSREYRIITKTGETKWVHHCWSSIIAEGQLQLIVSIVRDITERKKADLDASASQEKFKGLFMGNPEAAVFLGPDFHILDINPRFEELFGYSLAEVRGKHIDK
jgi:PAS domain S-box-containing protein